MNEEPAHDPRLNAPIVKEALRNWYLSLAENLDDVPAHLEALGIVLILNARRLPRTKPALTTEGDGFRVKLDRWRDALAELLKSDLNGGAR